MVAGELAGGRIGNDNLQSKLKTISLPLDNSNITVADGVSLGVGGQLAAGSVAAAEFNVFTCATGDDIYWRIPLKSLWDCDFSRDIQAEVFYESSVADDTLISMSVAMKGVAVGVAFTDAKVDPDGTALWTGLVTSAVASAPSTTGARGIGVAGAFATFTDTVFPRRRVTEDLYLLVAFTMVDDGDASADEIGIIDVLLHYVWEPCHWSNEKQLM